MTLSAAQTKQVGLEFATLQVCIIQEIKSYREINNTITQNRHNEGETEEGGEQRRRSSGKERKMGLRKK